MTRMLPSPHDGVADWAVAPDLLPDVPTRAEIEALGQRMQALEAVHGVVDISTMHHHAPGLYGRSVVLRAGAGLVGLPHRIGGLAICVGDITVWTEGKPRQRLTGAHVLNTQPGQMRVGFAHEDTTWFTVHANRTGSLDERVIEAALVEHPERLINRRATA